MVRLIGDGEDDIFVLVGDLKDFLSPELSRDSMVMTKVHVEESDAQILWQENTVDFTSRWTCHVLF